MASDGAQTFMDALREAERSREVAPLVALFAGDATCQNPARTAEHRGADGARRFWQDYLSAFEQVRSTFDRVSEGDGFAALEWHSDGRLPNGGPIRYRGVSLVEFDAAGRVRRFCTYYDSAAFLPNGAKHAGDAAAVPAGAAR